MNKGTLKLKKLLSRLNLELDGCEADYKDTESLILDAHKLIIKHPGWHMTYVSGDEFGIDSNYVFFTSRFVEHDVICKIGSLLVNEGADLPEEVNQEASDDNKQS